MKIVRVYPHHGFNKWMLVSYFYEDMSSQMKQILNTMCDGDFMNKSSDETLQFFYYMANVSKS